MDDWSWMYGPQVTFTFIGGLMKFLKAAKVFRKKQHLVVRVSCMGIQDGLPWRGGRGGHECRWKKTWTVIANGDPVWSWSRSSSYISNIFIISCYYIINLGCFICIFVPFYIIFVTNLFTHCLVSVVLFQKISSKCSPNVTNLFDDFFLDKRDPRSSGRRPEDERGDDKATGRALGVGAVALRDPRGSA